MDSYQSGSENHHKERKKRRHDKSKKDIHFQQSKHSLAIRKTPFKNIVKAKLGDLRIEKNAVKVLQLTLESFLCKVIEGANFTKNIITKYGRVTLEPRDLIPPLLSNPLTKFSFEKWIRDREEEIKTAVEQSQIQKEKERQEKKSEKKPKEKEPKEKKIKAEKG